MSDALDAAQAEIAALVRERRGPSCSQSLPFFVYRPRCKACREHSHAGANYGDEINLDLGAAMLGVAPRCKFCYHKQPACNESAPPHGSVAIAGCRSHGLRLLNVTTNASSSPKVLAVGSTLYTARAGDVVIGAGAKELQKGWALAHENASCADARLKRVCERHRAAGTCASAGAWGCKRTCRRCSVTPAASAADEAWLPPVDWSRVRIDGVRGPRTCAALRRANATGGCRSVADPALGSHLLLPSWAELRRRDRAADAPAELCVVPHFADRAVLEMHTATLQAARAERLRECRAQPDAAACRSISQVRFVYHTFPSSRQPLAVARALLACDLVLSSALHGIIFADALRVPSVWLHSPHASGGLTSQPPFKYRDYFESVGEEGRPVRTVEEALTLLDGGDLRPRFTLGRLLHFARRYVEAFPFNAVCDR